MYNMPSIGFVKLKDVLNMVPVGRTTWYEGVKDGRYPAPIRLSKRSAAYRTEDILDLIERLNTSGVEAGVYNQIE